MDEDYRVPSKSDEEIERIADAWRSALCDDGILLRRRPNIVVCFAAVRNALWSTRHDVDNDPCGT
jgi:hypothetical protein